MLNERTWSIKGLDLGWFLGVLKMEHIISFINFMWGEESKAPSKESIGRENFKQLPDSFSSSKVWMLTTWNFIEGPLGLLESHKKRSFYLRCSKYIKLLQERSKQSSSTTDITCFLSILDSFLMLGIMLVMSSTKCLNLPAIPLEIRMRVRWRFFHSLECGSGSLNALSSSSESTTSSLFSSCS